MATIKEQEFPLSQRDIDAYWDLVRWTLSEIFGESTEEADDYQQFVNEGSVYDKIACYHTNPFNLAADLAGVLPSETTESQYKRFWEKNITVFPSHRR